MPAYVGSSPLARGLPFDCDANAREVRIIPARAGFTRCRPRLIRGTRDHPRSRGVYQGLPEPEDHRPGSSPLARGLQLRRDTQRLGQRIIPARAGFTGLCRFVRGHGPDHPRSRGVYGLTADDSTRLAGSSPLARGLPARVLVPPEAGGIIPARAGFTRSAHPGTGHPTDHPRSRGVYDQVTVPEVGHPGSSPLARGLRGPPGPAARPRRIIPARAGFTRCLWVACAPVEDHPRSRGVYPAGAAAAAGERGSSPLARGLPDIYNRLTVHGRIIPARAGFTRDSCGGTPQE